MRSQQGHFRSRAFLIQIGPQPQDQFLWIERLAGVVGRAVLGTAPALYAGKRLQRVNLSDILAGDEAEILIPCQFGDVAEALSFEQDGGGAQYQVQVLGVRHQRQEHQQGQRVQPPDGMAGQGRFRLGEGCEVGEHQHQNQAGDNA